MFSLNLVLVVVLFGASRFSCYKDDDEVPRKHSEEIEHEQYLATLANVSVHENEPKLNVKPLGKKGMTWVKVSHIDSLGIDSVNCNNGGDPQYGPGCNAYEGDTLCTEMRRILCLKKSNATRPDYKPTPSEFYDGWSGGHISLTVPYVGTALGSKMNADMLCSGTFGDGWMMAEFHDSINNNGGGWGFRAYGNIPFFLPVWVSINNQNANCW